MHGFGAGWVNGRVNALALLFALAACGGSSGPTSLDDGGGPPSAVASVEVERGRNQSARPERSLPDSVVGRVVGPSGSPVSGQVVNLQVPAGPEAGSFDADVLQTNGQGRIFANLITGTRAWTARVAAGEDSAYTARLVASQQGRADEIESFTFSVEPGELAHLVGGQDGRHKYGHGDTVSLRHRWVRVEDEYGNPLAPDWHEAVADAEVRWEVRDRVFETGIRGPSGEGWSFVVDTVALADLGYPVGPQPPVSCDDGTKAREYLLEVAWSVRDVPSTEPLTLNVTLNACE